MQNLVTFSRALIAAGNNARKSLERKKKHFYPKSLFPAKCDAKITAHLPVDRTVQI